ncbi:MAG: trehalose-6-phosphate synthase, partial [Candidatus Sulfotelmatobacter sp.]
MRLLSARLIVSLILGVTLVSLLSSYIEVRGEQRRLRRDLGRRAEVLGESLAGNVEPYLQRQSPRELERIVERFSHREQLAGVAVYNNQSEPIALSSDLPKELTTRPSAVALAIRQDRAQSQFLQQDGASLFIYAVPLHIRSNERHDEVAGSLVMIQDASYIDKQTAHMWRGSFLRVLVQVLLIALITLLIVRWSIEGPIARAAQWMRALRTGRFVGPRADFPDLDLLRPLAHEVTTFAESLSAARTAAEKEAQLREAAESVWTADRLSVHIRSRLNESRLFVVSNREPYTHVHQGRSVQAIVPASGLVTALEPVLRASDGTWIAHGSGDADRETVDRFDRLRVPPEDPKYTLRRVWLTKEEEEGYYYGFSNEGLWPLCHIAHTRPLFRTSDWE